MSLGPARVLTLVVLALALECGTSGAAETKSGFVPVPGGRIFYEEAGSGPPLVMTHDGIVHRETWDNQWQAFAQRFRVVRWDRRGYGRSDKPTAPFSHLDDLLAVINTLHIERATLMGCSAGGLISVLFTLEHPDRVSTLVLVGPVINGIPAADHFITRGGRGLPREASVDQRIKYWSETDPWLTAPTSVAARARLKALLTANPQNFDNGGQLAKWPDQPGLPRLGEVKVPTLLITGESDIPEVHSHMGALQAGIKEAKRVVLAGSGHLPHLEVPDAFNREVLAFLQR